MIRKMLLLALAAASLSLSACDDVAAKADQILNGPRPTVTVVLIDRSRSIDPADRDIYLASIRALGADVNGGDRLLFAAVGDQTRASFRPALDIRVPRTSVRLDQEEAERAAETELTQRAPDLLAGDAADNSRILEAITAAAEAFQAAPDANHRLIVLTDAVEHSDIVNLDRSSVTPEEVGEAIARARREGLIPDLSGVELSFIGVGGRDFAGVESFWLAFVAASRANLARYGRLPYEPAR
jgi:hypothetical protein